MSIRFRKSIELGPAFRINISKSGLSFSAHVPGMKGLSVSTGQKGTYLNAGLPGTGLSSRTKLSDKGVGVNFKDVVKKIEGAASKEMERPEAEGRAEKKLSSREKEAPAVQEEPQPLQEILSPYLELHRKAPSVAALDSAAALAEEAVEASCAVILKQLQVPYLFSASYEFDAASRTLMLDVDLPEIEDIPDEVESLTAKGTLAEHRIPAAEAHANYVRCIESLAVYLAAAIFAANPALPAITLSGYTQRRNRDGDLEDAYVLSVRFTREGFVGARFDQMDDPEAFLLSFGNRMAKTKTGLLKKVVPYESVHEEERH